MARLVVKKLVRECEKNRTRKSCLDQLNCNQRGSVKEVEKGVSLCGQGSRPLIAWPYVTLAMSTGAVSLTKSCEGLKNVARLLSQQHATTDVSTPATPLRLRVRFQRKSLGKGAVVGCVGQLQSLVLCSSACSFQHTSKRWASAVVTVGERSITWTRGSSSSRWSGQLT